MTNAFDDAFFQKKQSAVLKLYSYVLSRVPQNNKRLFTLYNNILLICQVQRKVVRVPQSLFYLTILCFPTGYFHMYSCVFTIYICVADIHIFALMLRQHSFNYAVISSAPCLSLL